jgi:uncharacterized protein (DUF433 family)
MRHILSLRGPGTADRESERKNEMPKKLVTEVVGGEPYEYYPLGDYVVQAKGICDGRPVFKYTGVEVAGILTMLAEGDSIDEIVADYEGRISREAIVEAVRLAAERMRKVGKTSKGAAA